MSVQDENELEEEEEEEEDEQGRGFLLPPKGDACPNGHIDWRIVRRGNQLWKRCRRCRFELPFKGEVL
jgi:hypothetical protein